MFLNGYNETMRLGREFLEVGGLALGKKLSDCYVHHKPSKKAMQKKRNKRKAADKSRRANRHK